MSAPRDQHSARISPWRRPRRSSARQDASGEHVEGRDGPALERDWSGALVSLKAALELEPAHADLWGEVALLSVAAGRHNDALAAVKDLDALDPTPAVTSYIEARALQARGRHQQAVVAFELALAGQEDPGARAIPGMRSGAAESLTPTVSLRGSRVSVPGRGEAVSEQRARAGGPGEPLRGDRRATTKPPLCCLRSSANFRRPRPTISPRGCGPPWDNPGRRPRPSRKRVGSQLSAGSQLSRSDCNQGGC